MSKDKQKNDKIKCLLVNKSYTSKTGGVAHVIFNLYRAIDKSDIEFDLLATKDVVDDSYREEIAAGGGNLFVITCNFKDAFKYVLKLKKVIKAKGYDIVHIHGNSHTTVLELLAAKLAGCKVRVVHAHNTKCSDLRLHKAFAGLFNILCNVRLACGEEAGKFMHGKNEFTVINNGVELEKFRYNANSKKELKEQYNLSDKTVIGHIGSFNDAKNQDLLIEVIKEILKTNPNYALVLVGDGERKELIAQKAKDMGIEDSVIFVGKTDKVAEHLSMFDIFALPSFFEGLPLVLVEAQASGLRCVVSDCVTTEADKTGNMTFLPIDNGSEIWVEEILKRVGDQSRDVTSDNSIKSLEEKGYSTKNEAKKLLEIYKTAVLKIK